MTTEKEEARNLATLFAGSLAGLLFDPEVYRKLTNVYRIEDSRLEPPNAILFDMDNGLTLRVSVEPVLDE